MVAIVLDLGEELRHSTLSPVLAQNGQQMAQHVRLGDGAVDVRHHDLVVVVPQEDVALAACGALVCSRHREQRLITSLPQVQLSLEGWSDKICLVRCFDILEYTLQEYKIYFETYHGTPGNSNSRVYFPRD